MLFFEFVVLAEYWLAPLFLGVTNYAGTWSAVGIALFVVFATTLVVAVLLPLRPHLRDAMATRRDRLAFHSVWAAAFTLGLFVTYTFQLGGTEATSAAVAFGTTTVYGPFGAWPSLTFFVPALRLFGTLNVENLVALGLLSVLGASAVRLGTFQTARACVVDDPRPVPWARRAAAFVVWTPLGLLTGCTACAPLYLSAMGLLVPGVAAGGLSAVPLVPWIGFAGFLYLFSFGLALHLLRRATRPEPTAAPRIAEASPDG
ncbi:MAG: hypothetical protein L3J77_04900 [Thermoplasmata archaeon]|nr:hypothetical protein [Thermoplasmata archaeon]